MEPKAERESLKTHHHTCLPFRVYFTLRAWRRVKGSLVFGTGVSSGRLGEERSEEEIC
jgi:hypothetical protein